jgi:hypothetical protein
LYSTRFENPAIPSEARNLPRRFNAKTEKNLTPRGRCRTVLSLHWNDRLKSPVPAKESGRQQLELRRILERAKGTLQQRYNLNEQEAYLCLRNESRRLRRPIRELAEAILLVEGLGQVEAAADGKSRGSTPE